MALQGQRAIVFFLVQRTDAQRVSVAGDIDPAYAQALTRAQAAGVTIVAHAARIDPFQITLGQELPFKG